MDPASPGRPTHLRGDVLQVGHAKLLVEPRASSRTGLGPKLWSPLESTRPTPKGRTKQTRRVKSPKIKKVGSETLHFGSVYILQLFFCIVNIGKYWQIQRASIRACPIRSGWRTSCLSTVCFLDLFGVCHHPNGQGLSFAGPYEDDSQETYVRPCLNVFKSSNMNPAKGSTHPPALQRLATKVAGGRARMGADSSRNSLGESSRNSLGIFESNMKLPGPLWKT